jgi:hypothetical protein
MSNGEIELEEEGVEVATEKQIAANVRNARQSTGPRTSAGKARSAQNSFKHGLLARPALLPDEDATTFRAFINERIHELDPVGPEETYLAVQIAHQWWRLNRFPRIEAGLFIVDRAGRDHEFFSSRAATYRQTTSSNPDPMVEFMRRVRGETRVEITDEEGHAEAVEQISIAADAKRSELALLGSAFSSAAANGDPFGKLSRYETAALNRLRHLIADFNELQARRDAVRSRPEGAVEEPPTP